MKRILDSVILIDHFNNISQSTQFISKYHKNLAITFITRAEVLTGFTGEPLQLAKQLLDAFDYLPASAKDADLAAELRQKYRWKLPDAFQAAIAINHKYQLVTRNSKDFDPKHHHFVQIPYEIRSG